jgi:hypothetical protein
MGCSRPIVHVKFVSETNQVAVTVMESSFGPDGSVSVRVFNNGAGDRVVYSVKGDRIPRLSEALYDSEKGRLSVLVCDAVAGNPVLIGYDLTGGRIVTGEWTHADLRTALLYRYTPSPGALANYGDDPIEWACSQTSGAWSMFAVASRSRQMRLPDAAKLRARRSGGATEGRQ